MLPDTMPECEITPPEASAAPPFIAVVDDDTPFLRSVGRLLRFAGYAVETFSSARQFLASLATKVPRCLVLDVHMPEMTGLQLQEVLATRGCCVPVVLMTAYDTPQIREQARKVGSFGLLLKPFDQEALLRAVRVAIGCEPMASNHEDQRPAAR